MEEILAANSNRAVLIIGHVESIALRICLSILNTKLSDVVILILSWPPLPRTRIDNVQRVTKQWGALQCHIEQAL